MYKEVNCTESSPFSKGSSLTELNEKEPQNERALHMQYVSQLKANSFKRLLTFVVSLQNAPTYTRDW